MVSPMPPQKQDFNLNNTCCHISTLNSADRSPRSPRNLKNLNEDLSPVVTPQESELFATLPENSQNDRLSSKKMKIEINLS